jgi:SET domain-containing protein
MLMVQTKVRNSGTHGLGVFAAHPIPAGTLVWKYVEGFDFYISKTAYESFPEPGKQFVDSYCNMTNEGYLCCVDNARFMNHSDQPNISSALDENYALKDIAEGEEILCDYHEFDIEFKGFK